MEDRYNLFCEMIENLDEGLKYISEYDSLFHDYHGVVLYQAESEFINAVGNQPGITVSEYAKHIRKTTSACSQISRKLQKKGYICQKRNEKNYREYNLFLTEAGRDIYQKHKSFQDECYARTYHMLDDVNLEEIMAYIKVQQKLNKAFLLDVEDSRKLDWNKTKDNN